MSKSIEECGGYAFPCEVERVRKEYVTITDYEATGFGKQVEHTKREIVKVAGMTLRDWFAAQCLSIWVNDSLDKPAVARECYSYADAMIAERNK